MGKPKLLVGLGSCGIAAGAQVVYNHLQKKNENGAVEVDITSCVGMCYAEPLVEVVSGDERTLFGHVDMAFAEEILKGAAEGELPLKNRVRVDDEGRQYLAKQVKVALRHCGVINPESLEEYRAVGGYTALEKCLTVLTPGESWK